MEGMMTKRSRTRLARAGAAIGILVFAAVAGSALAVGTTTLIKDINGGVASSMPLPLSSPHSVTATEAGGSFYFTAVDPDAGHELFTSDGKDVTLVRNIGPGAADSNPAALTDVGGILYFRATTPTHGTELWRSDGTAAGTELVRNINPGSASSDPFSITEAGGTIYFTATDPTRGRELWRTDGTKAGTGPGQEHQPGLGELGAAVDGELGRRAPVRSEHPGSRD